VRRKDNYEPAYKSSLYMTLVRAMISDRVILRMLMEILQYGCCYSNRLHLLVYDLSNNFACLWAEMEPKRICASFLRSTTKQSRIQMLKCLETWKMSLESPTMQHRSHLLLYNVVKSYTISCGILLDSGPVMRRRSLQRIRNDHFAT